MSKANVISTRIDPEMLSELDRLAVAHRRSRAWLVNEAVRQFTRQEADLLELIDEGERSLRESPTISQDEMSAWIAEKRLEIAAKRRNHSA